MEREALLIMQVGALRCALPLARAVETLRPLPVRPLANAPAFVMGVCIVRGQALPVVDLGKLLGVDNAASRRFVVVQAGARKAVLAVEAVNISEPVSLNALADVPPLLSGAWTEAIAALGALDSELLIVLQSARLVPDEIWHAVRAS